VALFSDTTKQYDARVVGRDALTDTALIKLDKAPASLPTATLGDSDTLQPGDWVMAIGNPFKSRSHGDGGRGQLSRASLSDE
jgi:serine protease Do